MTLYLTESDVDAVLTVDDALAAVEGSFRRLAEGSVENRPRYRLRLDGGQLAVMAAADVELGLAGVKTYAAGRGGASSAVVLFDVLVETGARRAFTAVVDADAVEQAGTQPGPGGDQPGHRHPARALARH